WLQPCLLKIYSHMVTFWGNYEGISQRKVPLTSFTKEMYFIVTVVVMVLSLNFYKEMMQLSYR
ncbi:hypothetical protein OYB25_14835, partial [Escherichia coli]|nr:hypothetical protein [Escherichia coli]